MLDTQYPSVSGAYLRHYYDSPNSASDRLNRLGGLRLHDGGLGAGNRRHQVHYRYSGTGRLATLYSNSSSTFGINVRLDRFSNAGNYDSLDRFGRVVEQKWTQAGGTLDHFTMQHDYAGNLIQRHNVLRNANRSYGYDNLNRLLSSSETGSGASTAHNRYWDLDQLGNWEKLRGGSTASSSVLETRTFNQANELQTNTGGANPVHDKAGNMTGIPDPVNSNSLLGGTYDAWNRLVTLGSETYAYDGLNRRIIRQSGQAKHFYYNESWQVLTETDGSGSATAIYSYHPNFVDAVAVRMTPTGEHFFTHDHQYSVTSAVDRASNSVVERYDYSPYGESTVLDANFAVDADGQSDINNEYYYTGRRLDPSGLQLHRNRYYHPQLGQWINRDPLGYVDGMNLYGAYFVPGKMDPSGLCPDDEEDEPCGGSLRDSEKPVYAICDAIPIKNPTDLGLDGNCRGLKGLRKFLCEQVAQRVEDGLPIPDLKKEACEAICCSGKLPGVIPGDECISTLYKKNGDKKPPRKASRDCFKCCDKNYPVKGKVNSQENNQCKRRCTLWTGS